WNPDRARSLNSKRWRGAPASPECNDKRKAMSDLIEVRQVLTEVETIFHEFGPRDKKPLIRGAVAAVLKNPYAGRYEENILPMMEELNDVGLDMAKRLVAAMGVEPDDIESYGKGSIVGGAGELEHGA